jgi:hypothetical protein
MVLNCAGIISNATYYVTVNENVNKFIVLCCHFDTIQLLPSVNKVRTASRDTDVAEYKDDLIALWSDPEVRKYVMSNSNYANIPT